jgi:hypothetical protein
MLQTKPTGACLQNLIEMMDHSFPYVLQFTAARTPSATFFEQEQAIVVIKLKFAFVLCLEF